MIYFFLIKLVVFILLIVPLLLAIAFATLVERKIMASLQRRQGPNKVGRFGLLQPIADGLKLVIKEIILPNLSNQLMFLIAPMISLILSLLNWFIIPFGEFIIQIDLNLGILFLLATSSLAVYGIILAGWSSNSKYAFLGSIRSAAQMISYEVSIGLIIMVILLGSQSLNLIYLVNIQKFIWFILPFFPIFFLFLISALAETNRPPFDLPEAEAELVSGYNVEYAGVGFALFFIAEYGNVLLMSTFIVLAFFGGWSSLNFDFFLINMILIPHIIFFFFLNQLLHLIPMLIWFMLKFFLIYFFFLWIRASLPRYRYDQLMRLGWKIFLPLTIGFFLFYMGLFLFFI